MSAAELTAHKVYEKYQLGALPNDVKDQIIILMLSNRYPSESDDEESENDSEEVPPMLTRDELLSRIRLSKSQIDNGLGRPIEEFFDEVEAKYPWLCE